MTGAGRIFLLDQKTKKAILLDRIAAGSHFIVLFLIVLTVVSFGKREIAGLLPFLAYPLVMILLGRTSFVLLLRIYATVLPLFFFFTLSNLFFARDRVLLFGTREVSEGLVMSLSLILKGSITIFSVLSFIGLKGFRGLLSALKKLRVPDFFVMILSLTARYITVLLEEALVMTRAYLLRAPGHKGVYWKDWGPMGGQWFIRTYKRGERIQNAMDCRGGQTEYALSLLDEKTGVSGILWILFWLLFCLFMKGLLPPGGLL